MSKDNREECPDCKGSGLDILCSEESYGLGYETKCTTCKGTGEVTIDSGTDANGWISVEDRLPELTEIVLVYYWDEIIDRAWYRPNEKFYLEYNGYARVYENEVKPTHWQPLPKPPITIKGE